LLSVKFIFVLAAPIVKQKKWHGETVAAAYTLCYP
jgi:hypothetical protein